jgi:hypothetical protein
LEKPVKGFRFLHDGGIEDDTTKIGYIKPLMLVIFNKQNEDAQNKHKSEVGESI